MFLVRLLVRTKMPKIIITSVLAENEGFDGFRNELGLAGLVLGMNQLNHIPFVGFRPERLFFAVVLFRIRAFAAARMAPVDR